MQDILDDDKPYALRFAYSSEGERCVSVDDLVNWLLSITDGGNHHEESYKVVHYIIEALTAEGTKIEKQK